MNVFVYSFKNIIIKNSIIRDLYILQTIKVHYAKNALYNLFYFCLE